VPKLELQLEQMKQLGWYVLPKACQHGIRLIEMLQREAGVESRKAHAPASWDPGQDVGTSRICPCEPAPQGSVLQGLAFLGQQHMAAAAEEVQIRRFREAARRPQAAAGREQTHHFREATCRPQAAAGREQLLRHFREAACPHTQAVVVAVVVVVAAPPSRRSELGSVVGGRHRSR